MTLRLESSIERAFVAKLKKLMPELKAFKMSSPGSRGVPDRIILGEFGFVAFIEFKRKGAKPTLLQKTTHEWLEKNGFRVKVCDDADQAVLWIKQIRGTL